MIQKTINMEINYELSKERAEAIQRELGRLSSASDKYFLTQMESIDNLIVMANEKLVESNPNDYREVNQCISSINTALFLRDLYIYVATNDNLLLKIKNNG